MKVLRNDWMQDADRQAICELGIPSAVLMERAALQCARFFSGKYPQENYPDVLVVCGTGNNGGDGFACGRILASLGYRVMFLLPAAPEKLTEDSLLNYRIAEKLNLKISCIKSREETEAFFTTLCKEGLFIVDALLGTGLQGKLRSGLISDCIELINSAGLPVASVDIPSGLSDTCLPEESLHINAECCVTFQSLKTAHLYPDGFTGAYDLRVADIGIPEAVVKSDSFYIELIDPSQFRSLNFDRNQLSHKGDFGHVLTVGGSPDKPGAGFLASYAALVAGAGLSTVAVSDDMSFNPSQIRPEIMSVSYKDYKELQDIVRGFSVVAAGPGIGDNVRSSDVVSMLINTCRGFLVLDADALNVLAPDPGILLNSDADIVLTPHPGEFSRLIKKDKDYIYRNRIKCAGEFAKKYKVSLVLKGHSSVLALPDGRIFLNQTGNSGMATAGSGDVLTGIIAGLIAQFARKSDFHEILCAALFLHGMAGDRALLRKSFQTLTASDIIESLSEAYRCTDEYKSDFRLFF